MTPEAQRIAIAEACGIKPTTAKRLEDGRTILVYLSDGKWLPDYTNCLNAMHEAWNTLDRRQKDVFAGFLGDIVGGAQRDFGATKINCTTAILGATAAQRAEAFLKTIGKWAP